MQGLFESVQGRMSLRVRRQWNTHRYDQPGEGGVDTGFQHPDPDHQPDQGIRRE